MAINTPQTDAEKQLVQLLEGGQVRPEFARGLLKKMQNETREIARDLMAFVGDERRWDDDAGERHCSLSLARVYIKQCEDEAERCRFNNRR